MGSKYIEFSNVEKDIFKNFIKFIKSFGIKEESLYVLPWNKNGELAKISNKTITEIFHHILKIQKGKKFDTIYIPKIIKSSKESIIKSALRGAFDGDGYVGRKNKLVAISVKSKKYIKDIIEMLNKLGIYARYYGPDKKEKYHCIIGRKKDVIKFEEKVGFNHKKRKEWLNNVTKSFSKYEYSIRGQTKDNILKIMSKREKITARDLSKIIKRDTSTADFHLKKLFKEGVLNYNKKGKMYIYIQQGA